MLHLRLKAYLQAFMFEKEKVHGDLTILCSSSLPSSDISMYRCGFCFCLDLSMLLNFWIWSCMLNRVIGCPFLQCCHHHLLFLVLIISLLSLFHRFPLCPEQDIYRNIALLKSLWNYLSNVWSLSKTEFKQGSYVRFTSALRAVQKRFQDVLHSVIQA
jgi:hypothetical protein